MLTVMPSPADLDTSARVEGKCCHFTIRGYAANVRKSERNFSWPFGNFKNWNYKEKNENLLPPITFAEFRWWNCSNCLQVIQTDCTLENRTDLEAPRLDKMVYNADLPFLLTSEESNPSRKVSDDNRPIIHVDHYKFCSPSGCRKIKDLVRDAALKACQTCNEGFNTIQEDQIGAVPVSACDNISRERYQTRKQSKINITDFLRGLKKKDSFPASLAAGNSDDRTAVLQENGDNVPKKLAIPANGDATKENEDPTCISNNTDHSLNETDHHFLSNQLYRVGKPDHINKKSSSSSKLCRQSDDAPIVCNQIPEIISVKDDTQNVGKSRRGNYLSEQEDNSSLTAFALPSEKRRKKTQKKRMLSDIFESEVAGISESADSLQVEVAKSVGDTHTLPEIPEEHNSAGKQSAISNTKRKSNITEADDDESSLMSWFNKMPKKAKAVKSDKEKKDASSKQCAKPVLGSKGQNLKDDSNAFVQETVAKVTKGKDKGEKKNKNQPSHLSNRTNGHRRKMKNGASSQEHETTGKNIKEQNQIDHIETGQGVVHIKNSNDSLFRISTEVENNGVNLTNSNTESLTSSLAETERNISFRCDVDGTNVFDIGDSFENNYVQVGRSIYKRIFGSKDEEDVSIGGNCQSNHTNEIWQSVNLKGRITAQDGIPIEILKFLENKHHKQNSCENSFENLKELSNMTSEVRTGTILNFASFSGEGELPEVSRILMAENSQLGATGFVREASDTSNKNQSCQISHCRNSDPHCGNKPSRGTGSSDLNCAVFHINGHERIQIDESHMLFISKKLKDLSVLEPGKKLMHIDGGAYSPRKHISSEESSSVKKRHRAFKYETELLHASKRLQTLYISQVDESSKNSSNGIDRGHYPKNHLCRLHFKQPRGTFAGTVPSSAMEEIHYCHSFSLYPSRSFTAGECQKSQDIPASISCVEMLSKDALIKRKRPVESGSGVMFENATAQLLKRKQTGDFRNANGSRLESQGSSLVADNEYGPATVCPLNFHSNEPMSAMNLLKLMDPAVCSTQHLYASRENSHTKLLPCSSFPANHSYRGLILGCRRSDLENGCKQLPTNTNVEGRFHTANPPNMYAAAFKTDVHAQLFVKENPYYSNCRMLPFIARHPFPDQNNINGYSTVPYSFIRRERTGATSVPHSSSGNKRHIPCFQPGAYGQFSLSRILDQPLPARTEPAQIIAHHTSMAVPVGQKAWAADAKLQKKRTKVELCALNMNPADFTMPDENIDFMIRHGELGRRSWSQAKRRKQLMDFSYWQQQEQ